MRLPGLACILVCVLFGAGCGGSSGAARFAGRWVGDIHEGRRSTTVELRLRTEGGGVAGKLSVLSKTGEDVDQGDSFRIVNVERSGNGLKFVVPINKGKIDDDALIFDLSLDRETLSGKAHEKRRGSDMIPVTFHRQK